MESDLFLYSPLILGCGVMWLAPGMPIPCAGTTTNSPYAAGNGTLGSPYQICTGAQLNNIGLRVQDWNANFILEANVDLTAYSGVQFNLIGNTTNYFVGIFNGKYIVILGRQFFVKSA